ncbi:MAG: hypothetical protein H3C34_23980 [Caldilineaceae bacterium]|nr:hypothetical protein [Caldilineaceae bacterium]
MPLEHILAVLEEEFEAQAKAVEAEAAAEVEQLLQQAEADADRIRQQQLDAIQPRIQAEQSRRINAARMDAQRTLLEMKSALVEAVFDAARGQLKQARPRPHYGEVLSVLVEEVLAELGTPARLEIDKRDLALVVRLVDGRNDDIVVENAFETWGGVIGHSLDGLITVDNTLEARFARVQEQFRGEIVALLEDEALHGG